MTNEFYPHLHLVDGRPLPDVPDHLVPEITEACAEIKSRTGCTGFYHEGLKGVQYHVGDTPEGGPSLDVLFRKGRYQPINIENTVQSIHRATNKPYSVKKAEMDRTKADRINREYEAMSRRAADLAPELDSRLEFEFRKADNKHSQRIFHLS